MLALQTSTALAWDSQSPPQATPKDLYAGSGHTEPMEPNPGARREGCAVQLPSSTQGEQREPSQESAAAAGSGSSALPPQPRSHSPTLPYLPGYRQKLQRQRRKVLTQSLRKSLGSRAERRKGGTGTQSCDSARRSQNCPGSYGCREAQRGLRSGTPPAAAPAFGLCPAVIQPVTRAAPGKANTCRGHKNKTE